MLRYFIGFFVTIGLIILVIILLFTGNSKPKVVKTSKALDTYASTSAEASLMIDGRVNADQSHQQIKISVNRDNVTYEHINGYDGKVVDSKQFNNTESAYSTFLLALYHAGFTLGTTDGKYSDERGYCPEGNRYIFEFKQDAKTIERFWSSDCAKPKTYLGNLGLSLDLFRSQVPGYEALSNNVEL